MRFRTRSLIGPWGVVSSVAALLFVMVGSALGQSMMTRHTRREVTSGQAKLVNRMPGTQILRLDIVLPLRDQAGLEEFLQQVYDPTSPIYRHFLTVPEFTERFGPTQEDYDAVVAFAKGSGFKVVGGSRDGMEVQVEGSVTVIEAAFNVAMGVYQHPTENRTFYAPDREPSVPLRFALWHITGLDDFSIPHPALVHRPTGSAPAATTGSGPEASFLGSDMRAAYYGGTLTGTGQSIGLLEFDGVDLADVNTYFKNVKQTNKVPITLISADGTSTSCVYTGILPCDDGEQTIDITQAVSMAPGMSGLYVYVGRSSTAILSAMTTHSPLSAQLSCSWGWTPPDPATDDPYFEKFAAQGQNFFVAAGDNGQWTASNFAWPAEDPYVISVGGTSLTTSSAGGPWASEIGWIYSGGGISPLDIPIPSWQKTTGVITATNDGSTAYRNGPDVSANADFSYYVCADQSGCTANLYGGTSFAAPIWAGYMALVNQQSKANGHALLGFLNPLIYPLGLGANYNTYFHDMTSVSSPTAGGGLTNTYPVVTGYDLVTGWGSPNGVGLLDVLSKTSGPAPNFTISISPSSVTVQQGGSNTTTVAPVLTGGFDAAITLSAKGMPTGVTASFNPITVPAPGSGTSILTLAAASSTAPGTYTITVTGSGSGITNSATFSLTVAVPATFTLSASPTSVTVAQGSSGTSTITSAIGTGFVSPVALTSSVSPSVAIPPVASFSPNPIPTPGSGNSTMTIAVPAGTPTGKYTITVTGTGGGTSATTTVTLTVTVAPSFTISASPTSLSVSLGSSGTSKITTAISGSFNAVVGLSASGQPSGVTVTFNPVTIAAPGNGSSTMSMAVATTTTTGTYPITVTGSGGGVTQTTTVTLTVFVGPNFTITPSPASLSVAPGSSGTSTITTAGSGGFDSAIALSATGQPTGVTVSFNPTSIAAPGSGSSTMSMAVASTTATGTYPITVTGTGGGVTQTTTVTLTVTTTGGGGGGGGAGSGDFALGALPNSLSLKWGGSGSSTITTTAGSGFDSAISLSASGLPSDVIVTFSPTSIAAPGSGTSTMGITVRQGAPSGTSTFTVIGIGGGKSHTVTITLDITI